MKLSQENAQVNVSCPAWLSLLQALLIQGYLEQSKSIKQPGVISAQGRVGQQGVCVDP